MPQIVIGDMDSLSQDDLDGLLATGARIERYPAAKDETDLELALLAAVEQRRDLDSRARRGRGADRPDARQYHAADAARVWPGAMCGWWPERKRSG